MKKTDLLLLEKDVKIEQKLEKAQNKFDESIVEELPKEEPAPTKNIVVETPNYDLIPELPPEKQKRVLKLSKEAEKAKPKPKSSALKRVILGLTIALTVGLGVYSAVDLSASLSAYNASQSQYSINVANLLKNIASVDSGNKTSELIETFPKQLQSPSSVKQESNWFDRLCNFLSGMFK